MGTYPSLNSTQVFAAATNTHTVTPGESGATFIFAGTNATTDTFVLTLPVVASGAAPIVVNVMHADTPLAVCTIATASGAYVGGLAGNANYPNGTNSKSIQTLTPGASVSLVGFYSAAIGATMYQILSIQGQWNETTAGTPYAPFAQALPFTLTTSGMTLRLSDAGLIVVVGSSATTFTLPAVASGQVNLTNGVVFNFANQSAGAMTIALSGGTIYGNLAGTAKSGTTKLVSGAQYSCMSLVQYQASWGIIGYTGTWTLT